MADVSTRIPAPILSVVDGTPTTSSNAVARHFGRDHKSVLRTIENLLTGLPIEHQRNFAPMVTAVEIGGGATRQDPAYRLTRDGFTLLAMGFTGKKALAFKLAYIDAFNRMEAELSGRAGQSTITPDQKQHLHELVDLIAATGKQSHAETWTRLQRKMNVNKYELLRQDQFEAACSYLRGKMDGDDIGALVQKHFPQSIAISNASTQHQPVSIDPVELLSTGQADPLERLTSSQRTAIAQRAFELANEAYGLIYTHIERRVAFKANLGGDTEIAAVVKGVTLGNALTHRYVQQLDTMQSTIHWLRVTAEQTAQALHQDMAEFSRA